MGIEFRPMDQGFGAEVIGADRHLRVDDGELRAIEAAWSRHSILVFRDVALSPAEHVAFTRRLGPLHVMVPTDYNLDDYPEVFVVGNDTEGDRPIGLRRAGMGFHSDGEDKIVPNAGSFLHAIQLPPEGGDTLFADLYRAWDAVPPDIRAKVAGRRARCSRIDLHHVHYPHLPALTEQQKRERPDVWHPIARRHPKSGRTSLFVGRWACDIEGMPAGEGRAIIAFLQELAHAPQFVYRHRWQPGDAVLWDNRCTQHCATGFDEDRYVRRMHRTTLEGEAPLLAEVAPA